MRCYDMKGWSFVMLGSFFKEKVNYGKCLVTKKYFSIKPLELCLAESTHYTMKFQSSTKCFTLIESAKEWRLNWRLFDNFEGENQGVLYVFHQRDFFFIIYIVAMYENMFAVTMCGLTL